MVSIELEKTTYPAGKDHKPKLCLVDPEWDTRHVATHLPNPA